MAKKLIFAPLFLLSLSFLLYLFNPLFKSYDFIFVFSSSAIIQLITFSALISLTSLLFVLFAVFAYDWKLVLPISALASVLPIFLINQTLGLILAVGIFSTLLLAYLGLENTLKTYLNFSPASLFTPHVKLFSTLFILVISITYFLSVSRIIQEKGFQIPDELFEQALKLTAPIQQPEPQKTTTSLPSITPEQIELLRKNPDLLKQYGLDPSILDTISKPQQDSIPVNLQANVKDLVKAQLEEIINPYLTIIPAVISVLFFIILQSLVSIINFLTSPMLWGIFYVLEKTGFVKFTTEQRTVRKMVI